MGRLPCGSWSPARTRSPLSMRATARFRVEVVLATPPFWFANEMTLAVAVSPSSDSDDALGGRESRRNDIGASFGQSYRSPPLVPLGRDGGNGRRQRVAAAVERVGGGL